MKFNPKEDGVTHLNIYSQAATDLGKFLSNFAHCEIKTGFGTFQSVEGLWYYLSTDHPDRNKLRNLYGFAAKKLGRELKELSSVKVDNFQTFIIEAIRYKIINSNWLGVFKQSTLPFVHYYNFNGVIREDKGSQWVIDYITQLREELQNNAFDLDYK